jgi:hypothetical protein
MDKMEIFLATLEDIRNKIDNVFLTRQQDKINLQKRYDLIKACGLLRHLLTDKGNLFHQINRYYKVPLLFHVIDFRDRFPNTYGSFWFSLIPGRGAPGRLVELTEFLKITPLGEGKIYYSVKDIIRLSSHILGGIHTETPADEKENTFVELTNHLDDGVYSSIHSICTVSLKALFPLESAVRRHTPTGGFPPQY